MEVPNEQAIRTALLQCPFIDAPYEIISTQEITVDAIHLDEEFWEDLSWVDHAWLVTYRLTNDSGRYRPVPQVVAFPKPELRLIRWAEVHEEQGEN